MLLKRVVWFCLLILAFGPLSAYANSMVYDFTITRVLSFDDLNDLSTFTYLKGSFSLTQGQTPDFVGITDPNTPYAMFQSMGYYNTPFTMMTTKDGVELSESSGVGTVTFWWDGIALPNGFHVYNSPLPFARNDPYHPEFVAGHYWNAVDPFIWYDVVTVTPEPSTLMLLGTGILGGAAMLRRRECA